MGIDFAREMLDFMADHRPDVPPARPKGRIIEHRAGEGYSVFFEAREGSRVGILVDVSENEPTYTWAAFSAGVHLDEMTAAFRQAHEFVANMGLKEASV